MNVRKIVALFAAIFVSVGLLSSCAFSKDATPENPGPAPSFSFEFNPKDMKGATVSAVDSLDSKVIGENCGNNQTLVFDKLDKLPKSGADLTLIVFKDGCSNDTFVECIIGDEATEEKPAFMFILDEDNKLLMFYKERSGQSSYLLGRQYFEAGKRYTALLNIGGDLKDDETYVATWTQPDYATWTHPPAE